MAKKAPAFKCTREKGHTGIHVANGVYWAIEIWGEPSPEDFERIDNYERGK